MSGFLVHLSGFSVAVAQEAPASGAEAKPSGEETPSSPASRAAPQEDADDAPGADAQTDAEPVSDEPPAQTEGAPDEVAAADQVADAKTETSETSDEEIAAEEAGEEEPAEADLTGADEFEGADDFPEEEEEMEFGAVAEVKAPPREPTVRTMDQEQLTRIPGTRGDALRSVEIMPGVGRTEFAANDGAPLLRGSASGESLVLLDGAPVPLIYHFGGLTSFFNSHLLESVELYPGNYSARYGRAAGGLIEAKVRDPKTDGLHAMLELSAIDSFALLESPITDKTSVALAARRSNIDFFFDALVPDDAFNVLAAPVYWDYQAILTHRFSEAHKLRVIGFGSQDTMKLVLSEAAPNDPAVSGTANAKAAFHRAQIELESRLSETVEQNLMVSVGPSLADQSLGELEASFRFAEINARAEWTIFASPEWRFDTGLDFQMFAGNGRYRGPVPAQDEGNPALGTLAGERFITIDENISPIRPAAFVEASWQPTPEVLIIPGVRVDYSADSQDWNVDPRLAGRFKVAEKTTLKSGVGVYSQAPEYYEVMEDLGNPELKPYRTIQTSAGFEQEFTDAIRLDVDAFYKRWQNRVVGTEGGAPPRFTNEGKGRAYGLEFLLDVRLSKKSQAFASYTLSRSERQDRDDPWRLFDSDQTHNLSLTANYDIGKGWIAGARFRYVTGNPFTEVEGSVYDASTDTYRGLYSGVNGARNPAFHQLDVRVEKMWELGPVDLTTYLEVLNVYNAQNEEGTSYSYDYSETSGVTGMPIFPNLGIRGEF